VVHKDAIYLMGAMIGGYPKEVPLEHIWIYYPEKDSWEQGDEIPVERCRGGAGAVLHKEKNYMVCGIEYGYPSGTNNYFDSYDLSTGEWEMLTKAPHIRDHFPAIVVDNKLYCVGGRNTSVHFEDNFGEFFGATVPWVDVYDFEKEEWITLKEKLPFPTAAGGLIEIDNHLIYMGGEGTFPMAYNQTQSLDLKSGKWSLLAPLNTGRHGSGAILYQDQVYIAAGSQNQGGGKMNTVEVFSADHDWKSIFNGENMDGWSVQCIKQDRDKEFWKVRKNMLIANSMGNTEHDYMWLQSNEEYADFELRLKFQPSKKNLGNGGVQIRSRYDEKAKIEKKGKSARGWMDGPSICRVGEDYCLVNSTFEWFPGLPVYHSKDLVNWELIGHGAHRPEQLPLSDGLGNSMGVFAPTIREHEGIFYIINTCVACGGNSYITATNPDRPWSDPVWLDAPGIDPSLFWDDDGHCYYIGHGNLEKDPDHKDPWGVWMQELDTEKGKYLLLVAEDG